MIETIKIRIKKVRIIMEKYFVVRARGAGVFFGQIKERNGGEVTMTNARRIYYWSGATDCSQLAAEGVKKPDSCKFTLPVDEVVLLEVIEMQKCTPAAINSLKSVKVWKM